MQGKQAKVLTPKQEAMILHQLGRTRYPICIKVGYLPHHHDFRPRERPPYRTHSPQVIGDSSGVFFFVCTIPSVELA